MGLRMNVKMIEATTRLAVFAAIMGLLAFVAWTASAGWIAFVVMSLLYTIWIRLGDIHDLLKERFAPGETFEEKARREITEILTRKKVS